MTSHWPTSHGSNTGVHPLPARAGVLGAQASTCPRERAHGGGVKSASPRHFNCYIFSTLIWTKREASAKKTWHIKDYLPESYKLPVSLEESGLRRAGERGSEGLVWIPGWNEFDGLIVAPSGHRHTSQRAGRARGSAGWGWRSCSGWENMPARSPLRIWFCARGLLLALIWLSPVNGCYEYFQDKRRYARYSS